MQRVGEPTEGVLLSIDISSADCVQFVGEFECTRSPYFESTYPLKFASIRCFAGLEIHCVLTLPQSSCSKPDIPIIIECEIIVIPSS